MRLAACDPKPELLLFNLFLLTDADLGVQGFRIGKGLMIVARDRIRQIGIDVGMLRQDRHQREGIIAGRAEGPETLYIRDCHNFHSLPRP